MPSEAERHDHVDDRVEDVYAILLGTSWVIVDDEPLPVEPSKSIAVRMESARQIRAGDTGFEFIAFCAATH